MAAAVGAGMRAPSAHAIKNTGLNRDSTSFTCVWECDCVGEDARNLINAQDKINTL